MTNVSKEPLTDKMYERLHDNVAKTLIAIKDKRGADAFFSDILTPAEKIMIAKRLTIIFMLIEGVPAMNIHRALKVSRMTIYGIEKNIEEGRYEYLKKLLDNKRNRDRLWRDIEKILLLGMPPMHGKDRWQHLNKLTKGT